MKKNPAHEKFMRRALELARRGGRPVAPNPMVGCVLVKNGRVVAEGYHAKFGGLHAEAAALKKTGGRAKGATAYISFGTLHGARRKKNTVLRKSAYPSRRA